VLAALAASGGLEHARARGARVFSYFQVDNALARPADPLFLGLHALEGAQMSSKVVEKRDAAERVGVIGRVDGRLSCIEYSDLPSELRDARRADGELVYGAGNIAIHAIDLEFVADLTRGGLQLPWHVAKKSMAVIDARGEPVRMDGYKFETFVFDALAFARKSVTLEVDRALEFSPVKNAEGEDSPATARADICRLFAGWVERAGLPLPAAGADGVRPVEIDPCLAEDAETFVARAPRAPRITAHGHFYA
jgi:UDP-N-acetylglucosamine/UDP-N-acetylgalactosamine diphosphorylase